MEVSTPPVDLLVLGEHLVNELNLIDGVNTLGKWMAHHVAELIANAENAGAGRAEADNEARNVILEIWKHISFLPGNANPITRCKDALLFIEKLSTLDEFGIYASYSFRPEFSAGIVYLKTQELLNGLMLLELPGEMPDTEDPVVQALGIEERQLLIRLSEMRARKLGMTSASKREINEVDVLLRAKAIENIADLRKALDDIEEKLALD